MNFTESFSEFSKGLNTMDLALYAGAGIILWVLFKDQLSPVQKILLNLFNNIKGKTVDVIETVNDSVSKDTTPENKELFFDLVASWKQTRDLAEKSGCEKAVEVADEMFPYLSPMVCNESGEEWYAKQRIINFRNSPSFNWFY